MTNTTQHTLTIKLAHSLNDLDPAVNEGLKDKSLAGHAWYELSEVKTSFGYQGTGFSDNDYLLYQDTAYSVTINITPEQHQLLKEFNQENNLEDIGFGKDKYNLATNNCLDFVWSALDAAGINTAGVGHDALPQANINNLQQLILNNNLPVIAEEINYMNTPVAWENVSPTYQALVDAWVETGVVDPQDKQQLLDNAQDTYNKFHENNNVSPLQQLINTIDNYQYLKDIGIDAPFLGDDGNLYGINITDSQCQLIKLDSAQDSSALSQLYHTHGLSLDSLLDTSSITYDYHIEEDGSASLTDSQGTKYNLLIDSTGQPNPAALASHQAELYFTPDLPSINQLHHSQFPSRGGVPVRAGWSHQKVA